MTLPSASQLLLSAIILFVLFRSYSAYKHKNLSERFIVIWVLFWVGVLVLIYQQDLVSGLANKLGISRGVDLVIYLSLIAIFFILYKILILIGEIEEKITKIVRKNAINQASKKMP